MIFGGEKVFNFKNMTHTISKYSECKRKKIIIISDDSYTFSFSNNVYMTYMNNGIEKTLGIKNICKLKELFSNSIVLYLSNNHYKRLSLIFK